MWTLTNQKKNSSKLGENENPYKKFLIKDDSSKEYKTKCMRADFKYIGKNKVATVEDYDIKDIKNNIKS